MSSSSNSGASFIERNRPPRVHISYELETNGAQKKVELPFVMGVMADLSGKLAEGKSLGPVQDRKFIEFDVDNFDDRMKSIKPRVDMLVLDLLNGTEVDGSHEAVQALKEKAAKDGLSQLPNGFHKLELNGTEVQVDVSGDGSASPSYTLYSKRIKVQVDFESIGDFSPEAVAEKVGPLRELLKTRKQLANLTAWVDGRTSAEETLEQLIQDPALLKSLAESAPPKADN